MATIPRLQCSRMPTTNPATQGGLNGSQAQPGMGNQRSEEGSGPQGMTKSQSGTMGGPRPGAGSGDTYSDTPVIRMPANYTKFTSQEALGTYLVQMYHIRSANELSSCETCHR